MIDPLWNRIVKEMADLGFILDASERDTYLNRRYTIRLPEVSGDPSGGGMHSGRHKVNRLIELRLQYAPEVDARKHLEIAQEQEKIIKALGEFLWFQSARVAEDRRGYVCSMIFEDMDFIR